MAQPALVVRIAANVTELKANMAEGKASIEALGPSVAKMADTWKAHSTALIQNAHNITAAVNQVGASTLTAGDAAKNLKTLDAAILQLSASGKPIPPLMQSTADALRGATTQGSSFSGMLGKASGLLGAFGIGLSVGAVVSFGKAILADADALTKMHDKTGVSVQWLQKFQVAGDDAGNTVEDLSRAINQMQDRLVGGDKSAVAAVKALSINVEQFKLLAPEQQFLLISDRLREIEDPAKQVNVAMDIFGKSGAVILPTLKRGFDDLRDSVVGMSDATVASLDTAGDTLARWWRQSKSILAEAIVWTVKLPGQIGFGPAAERAIQEAKDLQASMAGAFAAAQAGLPSHGPSMGPIAPPSDDAIEDYHRMVTAQLAAAAAATKHREEINKLHASLSTLEVVLPGLRQQFGQLDSTELDAIKRHFDLQKAIDAAENSTRIGTYGLAGMAEELENVGLNVAVVEGHFESYGPTVEQATKQSLTFGEKTQQALSGVSSILSNIPGKFAEIGSMVAKTGEAIMTNLASGNVWGAVVAGVTGAIGVFSKLFKDTEKQVNPVRQAFIDTAGGLEALNLKAHDAGITLTALLNAKTPEAYEKAIKDINNALDIAKNKTAEKAKAVEEAAVREQAAILAVGKVITSQIDDLTKQRDGLLKSVENEAPEEVMGVIEAQTRGQIAALDKALGEQGRKLEEEAGDVARALEAALATVNPPTIFVPYEFRQQGPGLPGAGTNAPSYETPEETAGFTELGFAGGTGGRYVDFGRGTAVTLHGKERVVTEAEGRSASLSTAALERELRDLRRDLPRAMGVAVKDAMVLAR